MAHPYIDDIRKSHGDKLDGLVGARGEHASERAVRIVGKNTKELAAENTSGKAQRDNAAES